MWCSCSPLCPGLDHKTSPAAERWCSSRSRCCPQRPASDRASPTHSAHSGPGCLAWWGRWTCSQWSQCSLGSYPENTAEGEGKVQRLVSVPWCVRVPPPVHWREVNSLMAAIVKSFVLMLTICLRMFSIIQEDLHLLKDYVYLCYQEFLASFGCSK